MCSDKKYNRKRENEMKKKISALILALIAAVAVMSAGLTVSAEDTFTCTGAYYVDFTVGNIGSKEDFPVFRVELRFSIPVTMPAAENIWLRLSAESGDKQIKPQNGEASVEYIDPEEVDGVKYSDRIRLTFDGWTGMTDPSEVDSDIFKNGYYIVFTEYNSSMEDFIFDSNVVHGKNGETLLCNKQNGQGFFFNVVEIQDYSATTAPVTTETPTTPEQSETEPATTPAAVTSKPAESGGKPAESTGKTTKPSGNDEKGGFPYLVVIIVLAVVVAAVVIVAVVTGKKKKKN